MLKACEKNFDFREALLDTCLGLLPIIDANLLGVVRKHERKLAG